MSKSFKRILTMMLALTMLIGCVPGMALHSHAAEINGSGSGVVTEGLRVEWSEMTVYSSAGTKGDNPDWGFTINGSTVEGGIVDNTPDVATSGVMGTLTLTNALQEEAILTFKWEASVPLTGSYVSVSYTESDGTAVSEVLAEDASSNSGNKNITLAAGASVVFEFKTIRTKAGVEQDYAKLKLMDLNLYVDQLINTTFKAVDSTQGSYTVNGEAITADTVKSQKAAVPYELIATPAEGYVFSGWYSITADKYLSTDTTATLLVGEDHTIYPKFIKGENAIWGVGNACFESLDDAFFCAERSDVKVVTLLRDYTLTGTVTIPKNIVLLVPFDKAGTCYTADVAGVIPKYDLDGDGYLNDPAAWQVPYAFRTLTLAENAKLIVEGGLSISAQHHGVQGYSGAPSGPCGFMVTKAGAEVSIEDGGALYAWGYVIGSGKVEAKSGASVYENLQITDFRGGSASKNFINTDPNASEEVLQQYVVFPFTQYYVQNIEIPLTIHSGAKESVRVTIYAASSYTSVLVDFIGTDISMFRMESGATITKAYDGRTDRIIFDVNGNVSLNGMTVKIAGFAEDGIESSMFNLPINSNITICVNSGTTSINQNVALLPGVVVDIAENATLVVNAGWDLYVYDRDDWMDKYYVYPNVHLNPIRWTSMNGQEVVRTNESLLDAKINVNGLLEVQGYIYSTANGADVCSSKGTGVIWLQNGCGSKANTYQATQMDTNIKFEAITLIPLQLKNGSNADKVYTSTVDADRVYGSLYMLDAVTGTWYDSVYVIFDGNGAAEGAVDSFEITNVDIVDEWNDIELPENGFVRPGYSFVEWNTQADGKGTGYQPGDVFYVTENVTLYAMWACQHTKTSLQNAKEPTCTEEGYTGDLVCECGYVVKTGEVIEKAEHAFTKNLRGSLKTPGNCTTEAVYAVKCDNCTFESEKLTVKGEKDASKHTGKPVYTNNSETHSAVYDCCSAVYVTNEPHTYDQEGGKCICGAVKPHVCSENLTEHKAVTPTCEYAGNTAYWSCTCGKFYADATATQEIAKDSWILPKAEHTFTKNLRGVLKTAGNCTTEAVYAAKCDNCAFQSDVVTVKGEKDASKHTGKPVYTNNGETHSAVYDCCSAVYVTNEPHTYDQEGGKCICGAEEPHVCAENLTEHKAVTPDCQTVGNTAYWSCTCGKFYADANATQEIAKDSWILGKGDHAFTQNLRGSVKTPGNCTTETVYAVKCDKCDVESEDLTIKGEKEASKHTGKPVYTNNGDTHSAAYNCCGAAYVTNEAHKYEDATYKCVCGALYSGIYTDANGDKFFVVEGVAIANKGLVRVFENGEAKYYYFGCAATANDSHEDNSCDAYKAQKNCTHWVENTNGLLPAWDYTFGADGAIVYDDELNNNEQQSHKIVTYGDVKYYTIDGIKVPMGLVKMDGAYYYVRSNGALVCGQTYWVTKTNDLLPEGSYTFDAEGKMVDAPELPEIDENTNGIVGGYYYERGELTYAGLIEIEGKYYYVRSNGKLATGAYWVTKTNGLMPEASYNFDENGVMLNPNLLPKVDENTTGVLDGYYFENGVITYAGLIKLEGAYYYVRSNGQVAVGGYWISKTNGLLPEGRYTFAEDGKMVNAPEMPDVEEGFTGIKDGYYFENGVITYAGLIQLDGKYYYVRTSGKLATGKYWVTKTNGLLPEGSYNFGADGAMIVE